MSHIIPVLDVRRGQVVLAERGRRHLYRPVRSVLTASTDAASVLRDLLARHRFSRVYCADLDAIEGGARQTALWRSLCRSHPGITFWLDAGIPQRIALPPNCRLVAGTECLRSAAPPHPDTILSLDFDEHGLRGKKPARGLWKHEVIAMFLHRVGSAEGPDWNLLRQVRRQYPCSPIIAGGGVRDHRDLRRLRRLGMDALVAGALHSGRIRLHRMRP